MDSILHHIGGVHEIGAGSVAIVKMEDALRDLYEAADAVLIEQLETHPHFGCTALHWLGEETEADPEFGISLDVERLRARMKRHHK